jgi:glycosyltransferase involved in cell wall biosynthesis
MRVVTSVACNQSEFWEQNTRLISDWCLVVMYDPTVPYWKKHLLAILVALKVICIRSKYDAIVVDGGLVGNWVSWIQSIVHFGKKPTIMIDCLWAIQTSPLKQKLKIALHRLSSCSVDKFVVWARHEKDDFSRIFGIQAEKFNFIPYHTTLYNFTFEIKDDGYVFAGGNSDRDYRTLIEAMRGLDIPLFIASSDERLFEGLVMPPNVTVKSISDLEFREKMAAARITVVPIKKGLLRSPGQQTILNSMAMGKPTIVVGPRDAEDYITDGVTGVVVEYEDVKALKNAIVKLYYDEEVRHHISRKSAEVASEMDFEKCFRAIFELAVASI